MWLDSTRQGLVLLGPPTTSSRSPGCGTPSMATRGGLSARTWLPRRDRSQGIRSPTPSHTQLQPMAHTRPPTACPPRTSAPGPLETAMAARPGPLEVTLEPAEFPGGGRTPAPHQPASPVCLTPRGLPRPAPPPARPRGESRAPAWRLTDTKPRRRPVRLLRTQSTRPLALPPSLLPAGPALPRPPPLPAGGPQSHLALPQPPYLG